MKLIVALACLSGSAVRAEPDTGAYAAARLGVQATSSTFGDTGSSPLLELELGHREETWLAFSAATSVTRFDAVDATTRLVDGRARATFSLDDPSTTAHATYFAGIGFGVLHTRRDGMDVDSRLGPLGELFLGLDRQVANHVALTLDASIAMGAGFLGRVSAGVSIY